MRERTRTNAKERLDGNTPDGTVDVYRDFCTLACCNGVWHCAFESIKVGKDFLRFGTPSKEAKQGLCGVVMRIDYREPVSLISSLSCRLQYLRGSSYSNSGPGACSGVAFAFGSLNGSGKVFIIRSWYANRISTSIALLMKLRFG